VAEHVKTAVAVLSDQKMVDYASKAKNIVDQGTSVLRGIKNFATQSFSKGSASSGKIVILR
jgi:hypothetical protein